MVNWKNILRIIIIFLIIYVLFGIGQSFFTGDHTFFEEFIQYSKGDALFVTLLWPIFFILLGGIWMLVISLIILAILILISWFIDKKLFRKNELTQAPKTFVQNQTGTK